MGRPAPGQAYRSSPGGGMGGGNRAVLHLSEKGIPILTATGKSPWRCGPHDTFLPNFHRRGRGGFRNFPEIIKFSFSYLYTEDHPAPGGGGGYQGAFITRRLRNPAGDGFPP